MNTALIIPTLNAGSGWERTLEAIDAQTTQPDQKILLDSRSVDSTLERAEQHGFEYHAIRPSSFNHGLTRQAGADLCPNADILIYLTQDALPAGPNAFETLLEAFENPETAAAYGRQLPPAGTPATEVFARQYNYPPQSRTKNKSDIPELGLQTTFCSNSFAAWRKTTLDGIGGFEQTPFGEDMLAAARLILTGYSVAYCAEAEVFHAHPLSLRDTFRRGRQIGEFHRQHPWLHKQFGSVKTAGCGYILSGMRYLAQNSPQHIPLFIFQSAIKFLGFLSGKSRVS